MYIYTICFIRKGSSILMLNRFKHPVMGLWQGVGGKINKGETPRENIIREIYEETNLLIRTIDYKGIISWEENSIDGGMYVYIAEVPVNLEYYTPKFTNEGILDWKELSWIIDSKNRGIPPHVSATLPILLNDSTIYNHKCTISEGKLIDYKSVPIYN